MTDADATGNNNKIANPAFVEKGEKERDGGFEVLRKLSPLELAIRSLVACPGRGGDIRIAEDYRPLFASLTLRQLKAFLRERLFESVNVEDETPALSLLRNIYHPFWRLHRHEPDLYRHAHLAAKTAQSQRQSNGRIDHEAVNLFFQMLVALARRSSILDEVSLEVSWPRKRHERELLIHLLALAPVNGRNGSNSIAMIGTQTALTPLTANANAKAFIDWVEARLGARPRGFSSAEQLSSFQDLALLRWRGGMREVASYIGEYADTWLERHLPLLDAGSAPSLSNLATIINDQPGLEAACDRLFRVAIQLAGGRDARILLFYVEFVLDAADDTNRLSRVLANYRGGDENEKKALLIDSVMAQLNTIHSAGARDENTLYREALLFRLARLQDDKTAIQPPDLQARLGRFIHEHMDILEAAARMGVAKPVVRVSNLLDTQLGDRGAALARKGELLADIWAHHESAGVATWMVRAQLANDYVGEGEKNSSEEKIGLRLNAGLVVDANMLGRDTERAAAIWAQSGLLLSSRIGAGPTVISRVALAFLASQVYGGGSNWQPRLESAWQALGLRGEPSARALENALAAEHRAVLERMRVDPMDVQAAHEAVRHVFGPEYMPAIATADDFLMALETAGWSRAAWETARATWRFQQGQSSGPGEGSA